MCGITGFVDFKNFSTLQFLENMVRSLDHRGPDDFGVQVFENENGIVGLGQSRLSIIDLSNAGHQPMTFRHLTIVFNGEIYNYKEIKKELLELGHKFVSDSDTEVILHAYYEWGNEFIQKLIGMFAFAIYNDSNRTLHIYRDRVGVKPLYYYQKDGLFLFGSELKSLMEHPKFEKEINCKILPNYLQLGYIPAPYSIFRDCYKLLPGHYLVVDLSTGSYETFDYWNAKDYFLKEKSRLSYTDAKLSLKSLLQSAFDYRMVADVPVGVFLSGGYDSTAVAAILQHNKTEKLKTFTIGFEEGNNEAPFAWQTATYLGTDHTEYICTTAEAQAIIPNLPHFYDEPFGDSSAIPTTLVSQLAKKSVTVALSADGGDEVFCGYASYFNLNKFNNKFNRIPKFSKKYLSAISPFFRRNTFALPVQFQHQLTSALEALNANEYSQFQILFQRAKEKPMAYINSFFNSTFKCNNSPYDIDFNGYSHPIEMAMLADIQSYLPDDILTKVDRATMSVSLEGREPLLDHRIIEFAATLPIDYKFNGETEGKRILKDIVHDYVPKEMMDRPKSGFSLPIYSWLRGDLSYLLDEYLSKEALAWSGIWDVDFVFKQVQLFKEKKLHYLPLIWYVLMFQMWWKRWMMN
ncbi:asparagine synthase (glutamine-hydrolyzing) [Cyclobacteriaceae bacterium YHN15]|nr:asparagine synthase (glutamine-hydrolyzing) [Cyclobacteriaceae bacterium YHN15]